MKRTTFLAAVISLFSFFLLTGANTALAAAADPGCAALGGNDSGLGTTCTVNVTKLVHTDQVTPITLGETLHILGAGKLITGTSGAPLGIKIVITSGDFVMDSGALIDGNVAGCNTGGAITVDVQNGNIDLKTGSTIRSDSCSGGPIVLTTSDSHTANIDGLVESVGSISGTGGNQRPGGGPITIIAGCSLTVSDTGRVSSRGADPGADRVHLEGCTVTIFGLVESTGPGHVVPLNPPNHCDDNAGMGGGDRPDKPHNSTACVEIWSGSTVLIDSTPPHNGQINADIGQSGGNSGTSWIDIYANGDITIKGDTSGAFAVHANMGVEGQAGVVTVKSTAGSVFASGLALQADNIHGGGNGGTILVEAKNNVDFSGASIFARGDFVAIGGFGNGGHIGTSSPSAPIKAFTGAINWPTGVGDVRPTGDAVPLAQRGEILLDSCTGTTLGVTSFPVNGSVVPPFPVVTGPNACSGAPTLPAYVDLPAGNCLAQFCEQKASKSGTKFSDLDGNHKRDPGEPVLPGWTIKIFNSSNVLVQTQVTDINGNYFFNNLSPGTYTVCEVPQAIASQTCPQVGLDCNLAATTTASCALLVPGGTVGYLITLAGGDNDTGNDFGNFILPRFQCPEDPTAILTSSVGNPASGVPNFATVQAAYNAASDGAVIGLFSSTKENVVLGDPNGNKTLKITQCTTAKITAADNSLPVWSVTSTGKLTIVGPDSVGGNIGWLVGGNGGHTLKSVRANGASLAGIAILSDKNSVSWNDVSGNGPGAGIVVGGSFNTLKGGTVGPNTGDGVQVQGNSNSLSGATLNGNTGSGVVVSGSNNTIKSNKANSNGFDGFWNFGGAGNNYSGNSSNTGGKENGDAEYRFTTAGVNGGSNRADGVNVPSASKCTNFAQAGSVCD